MVGNQCDELTLLGVRCDESARTFVFASKMSYEERGY